MFKFYKNSNKKIRTTTIKNLENINDILEEAGNNIHIVYFLPKSIVELNNGQTETLSKFAKRCNSPFFISRMDEVYSLNSDDSSKAVKMALKEQAVFAGKKSSSWMKGKTKDTDDRIKKHFSTNRLGKLNTCHRMTEKSKKASRLKQSNTMKKLILEGKFTPKSSNRFTHPKQNTYNGIEFRSTWEIDFYKKNKDIMDFEYEKIRIPYIDENKTNRVYIPDFLDKNTNTIYEIKPSKFVKLQLHKLEEANKWCIDNGYKFIIITEVELYNEN